MKTSNQLKALLRNLSKITDVSPEVLLRNFMLERFLERVSLSKYKNNFILKGGLLIADIIGIDNRSTMDMDANIKGHVISESEVALMCKEIINISIDDGVNLIYTGIEEIREEADYPGFRVSINATLDKTRQSMKIDITTGDYVTPKEINYDYKLMFEDRTISLMTYNIETVLAEKLETIVSRGILNSRMKDFYDIYILTATQKYDTSTFEKAFHNTLAKRKSIEQITEMQKTLQVIKNDPNMINLWKRYQQKNTYASDVDWITVTESIKILAKVIY